MPAEETQPKKLDRAIVVLQKMNIGDLSLRHRKGSINRHPTGILKALMKFL